MGEVVQRNAGRGQPRQAGTPAEAEQGGQMATAAGIWNQHVASGQSLVTKSATPMTTPTSGSGGTGSTSSSSSDSSTISANDFLTLLVTEMQNQDPTASTDPNEYINQLVQVNSLEQLISINQNLSTALGSSSSSASSKSVAGSVASQIGATSSTDGQVQGSAQQAGGIQSAAGTVSSGNAPATAGHVSGNLSIPATNPDAQRVAQALNGQSRAHSPYGGTQ
jgi:flagellar basal-body rod modification protein FlgD